MEKGNQNCLFIHFAAGPTGFEPAIFCLTSRRVKPGYTTDPTDDRGGDRTHDLGLMSPTLYQLSYPATNECNELKGCGGPNCTVDLLVMSQTRYYFSTPLWYLNNNTKRTILQAIISLNPVILFYRYQLFSELRFRSG